LKTNILGKKTPQNTSQKRGTRGVVSSLTGWSKSLFFAEKTMAYKWHTLGDDLLNLFWPRLCPGCTAPGLASEALICLQCQAHLPYTGHHHRLENAFTRRFWGRLPIESGAAMLTFSKGGRVQRLLHALKYRGRQDLGVYLGRIYGNMLAPASGFADIACILPVPLHPRRLQERGYNQSACIAQGLSETMGVPWSGQHLRRVQQTTTQTHKSRVGRFDNVGSAFALENPLALEGKNILLVDDVLTTGATLEACGSLLLQVPGLRLSLATLAMAAD
jgi:ComF family protein